MVRVTQLGQGGQVVRLVRVVSRPAELFWCCWFQTPLDFSAQKESTRQILGHSKAIEVCHQANKVWHFYPWNLISIVWKCKTSVAWWHTLMATKWPKIWHVLSFWPEKLKGVWNQNYQIIFGWPSVQCTHKKGLFITSIRPTSQQLYFWKYISSKSYLHYSELKINLNCKVGM